MNALNALQNLFRVTSFFSSSVGFLENMCLKNGLVSALEKLQGDVVVALQLLERDVNVQHVCCCLLSLLTEVFECGSEKLLQHLHNSSFFSGTLSLIVTLTNKVVSEEVFLGVLHYLKILSESVPKVNELIATSSTLFRRLFAFFQGDFADTPVLQSSSFTYKLKICSLLLPVVFAALLSMHRNRAS